MVSFDYYEYVNKFGFIWYIQRSVIPLVSPLNFMHPNDHLILEDESGRVKLVGEDVCAKSYVTGMLSQSE